MVVPVLKPPLDLQGEWELTADFTLNGTVDVPPAQTFTWKFDPKKVSTDPVTQGYFYGHFTHHPNNIDLWGQVIPSAPAFAYRGTLVSIMQNNGDYWAAFCGLLTSTAPDTIEGSWIDVEDNKGDFKLIRTS